MDLKRKDESIYVIYIIFIYFIYFIVQKEFRKNIIVHRLECEINIEIS